MFGECNDRLPRVLALLIASAVWVSGCSGDEAAESEGDWQRPNIVLLMAEDIGLQLGAYGDEVAVTPTIDRLASEGMRYDMAFAPSGVCAPARTSLMMGTYPSTIGGHHMRAGNRGYDMVPPPDMKGYAEMLRAAGYYCTNNSKTDYQMGGVGGTPPSIWDEVGDVDWRGRAPGQPFLAVFTLFESHESRLLAPTEGPTDPASVSVPPYYPDTPVVREDYVRYYNNIDSMDGVAARILNRLEADGLTESTLVVFIGDNGAGFPRDKRWPYDGGIHVPMIVRFPGRVDAGSINEELISFVDFAPTLLTLAGVEVPEHMPGRVFLGPDREPERDYVFAGADRHSEAEDRIRVVRDRQYKYVRHYRPGEPYGQPVPLRDNVATMQEIYRLEEAGELFPPARWFFEIKPEEELYDTLEDPFEIDNRVDDPSLSDVLSRMRTEHERWRAEFDVWGGVPEAEMAEQFWPNGEQPETLPPVIDPPGGALDEPATVRLESATEGASIEYTLESGDDARWRLYTGEFEVVDAATLRARAVRYGFATSDETTASFVRQ
ncbi:MAG: sulfatase-like hydrolase/transferase [Myxococcota bacterium]